MSKTILINAREAESQYGEARVAIVEDGTLTDFDIDSQWKEKSRGNIYCGVVTNVEPSLQAAFVDFGAKKQGFLPFSDVAPHAYKSDHPANVHTITDALKRKQRITVQVLKEEVGNKGAALTTYVSLPGRYLVLMPNGDGAHISRKIEDEDERKRIKALARSLNPPDDVGLIVRTAGMEQPKETLQRDLQYLLKLWGDIDARVRSAHGPKLVHRDHDTILRTLRDYVTPDVNRIIVDTEQAYETARAFLEMSMPEQAGMLEHYAGKRPLFTEYSIDSQVEGLFERRAPLPSGGYLIIDQTEALVAIDVNSGRMTKEGSQEETAYRTNMEAVPEVARQLKLRDLGGIVVVDFIDMMKDSHRQEVEKRFREAIKADKARFRVSGISQHGLLELTRQRIRPALMEGMMTPCAHCEGRGRVRAVGSEGSRMLRAMADRLSVDMKVGFVGVLTLQCATRVALHLLNDRRDEIAKLESEHHVRIKVDPKDALPPPHYALLLEREQVARVEEEERVERTPVHRPAPQLPKQEEANEPKQRRRRGRGGKGRGGEQGANAEAQAADRPSERASLPQVTEARAGALVPPPLPHRRRPVDVDEEAFSVAVLPMPPLAVVSDDDIVAGATEADGEQPANGAAVGGAPAKKRRRRRGGRGRKRPGRAAAPAVPVE